MIVNIEMPDLKEVESLLETTKSRAPMVLRNVLNDTAKATQRLINQRAAKKYANHRQRDFRGASEISQKATVSNLCAKLAYRGDNGELYKFKVSDPTYYPGSRNGPKQLKGKVIKSNKLGKLKLNMSGRDKYKAFVVKFKSGHITVAQRIPGKRMKSNPAKEALKVLFAPSIPTMATNEKDIWDDSLLEAIQDVVNARMVNNIEKYLEVKYKP